MKIQTFYLLTFVFAVLETGCMIAGFNYIFAKNYLAGAILIFMTVLSNRAWAALYEVTRYGYHGKTEQTKMD